MYCPPLYKSQNDWLSKPYFKLQLSLHSFDMDVIHIAGSAKDSVIIRMSELLTVTSWVEDWMLTVTIEEVSLTPLSVCQDNSASMSLWNFESETYFSSLISVQSSLGQG